MQELCIHRLVLHTGIHCKALTTSLYVSLVPWINNIRIYKQSVMSTTHVSSKLPGQLAGQIQIYSLWLL